MPGPYGKHLKIWTRCKECYISCKSHVSCHQWSQFMAYGALSMESLTRGCHVGGR
ncbi:hypothetical protein BKA93DRAFT_801129 [Sparassis latifolia]